MLAIYLAALRNPSLVSTYQTNPGMLYGTPFATGMENYFQKIKNYFGQSMFDQLVTEFAQQSNLYVDEIKVDEWHIYGSSRLGIYEANKTISRRVARDLNNDNQISNNEYEVETPEEILYLYSSYQLERGAKRYELANHLGNVLTVISDKKTANFTGSTFTHFTAERISATDYSPFGAPLAGRTWNGGEYRFGFNSMEKDNEINGTGNAYDFGARIYDARLGRWMSVDPLSSKNVGYSVYHTNANNPIIFIDPDGRDNIIYLVVLPSAMTKISEQQANDIANIATRNFHDLGLKTEVRVIYEKGPVSPITKNDLDKTDAVAVLGEREDVANFIKDNIDEKKGKDMLRKGGFVEIGKNNKILNPEESSNGHDFPEGNAIGIDVNQLDRWNKVIGWGFNESSAFLINHGAGHCSDGFLKDGLLVNVLGHSEDLLEAKIMDTDCRYEEELAFRFRNKTEILCKEMNVDLVRFLEARFGNNKAKDNRNKGGSKKNDENSTWGN